MNAIKAKNIRKKKRANINAVFQIILQRKKPKEKQIENEAKKKKRNLLK